MPSSRSARRCSRASKPRQRPDRADPSGFASLSVLQMGFGPMGGDVCITLRGKVLRAPVHWGPTHPLEEAVTFTRLPDRPGLSALTSFDPGLHAHFKPSAYPGGLEKLYLRWALAQTVAQGAAYATIPAAKSALMSASLRPSEASTSAVCWPGAGEGPFGPSSAPGKRTGEAGEA